MIYPDGIVYEGNFEDGKYNGKGIIIDWNNIIYDGFFKNNKIDGTGKIEINSKPYDIVSNNGIIKTKDSQVKTLIIDKNYDADKLDGLINTIDNKNKKINIIIDLHGKTNDQGVCVLYTQNNTKEDDTVSFMVGLIDKVKKERPNISRIKINLTSCLQKINKEQIEHIANKIGCINLKIAYGEYANYSTFYLSNAPFSYVGGKRNFKQIILNPTQGQIDKYVTDKCVLQNHKCIKFIITNDIPVEKKIKKSKSVLK